MEPISQSMNDVQKCLSSERVNAIITIFYSQSTKLIFSLNEWTIEKSSPQFSSFRDNFNKLFPTSRRSQCPHQLEVEPTAECTYSTSCTHTHTQQSLCCQQAASGAIVKGRLINVNCSPSTQMIEPLQMPFTWLSALPSPPTTIKELSVHNQQVMCGCST